MPKLLNGCCKSVVLAEAFESAGWDVWTCDIQPSEGWPKHIEDDVLNVLDEGWDMAIFHPDCTYLANSGVRWLYEKPERLPEVEKAAAFFNKLLAAQIPRICTENPIQHHFARRFIRKYDQLIHPWMFGDNESKATCLWLVNLPPLLPLYPYRPESVNQSVFMESPGPDRKANRSRNWSGISNAMMNQWRNYGN